MALRIWLPLIGSHLNKGVFDEPTWSTAAGYVSTGKIGNQSLSSGAAYLTAAQAANILNNNEFSFACWVYVNADTGDTSKRYMYFGTSGMSANNNRKFSIFQYPTVNDLHLSWMNDAASTTYIATIYSGVIPSRTWTHIAVAYKNPNGRVYINGNQIATFSGVSNSSSFAYQTPMFENAGGNKYLQDYRIYDHCLSVAEVQELAKGLITHYKFDNSAFGNINLAVNTNTDNTGTNTWYMSYQTGDTSRTIEYDEFGNPCLKITKGSTTASGWSYLHYDNIRRDWMTVSTTYTASFDVKTSVDGSITMSGIMNGNATNVMTTSVTNVMTATKANQWSHIVYRFTMLSSYSSISVGGQCLYLAISGSLKANGTWMMFKNLKIEEGETDTAYWPNRADDKARAITTGASSDTDVIYTAYDSSGHNNNGSIATGVFAQPNSKLYNSSAIFYSGAKVTCSGGFVTGSNPIFTVNFWVQMNGNSFTQWSDVISFPGNYTIRMETSNTAGTNLCWYNYPLGTSSGMGGLSVSTNTWYMLTLVSNGTQFMFYSNGKKYGTTNMSGTAWSPNGTFTIGDGGMTMRISDVRTYATALSDYDIEELYYATFKADNGGNVICKEIKERYVAKGGTNQHVLTVPAVIDNMFVNNITKAAEQSRQVLGYGTLHIVTTKDGHNVKGSALSLSSAKVQALAGRTLIFSYDVCASGARYSTEQGQTAWSYTRYGIHGSISISGSANYPFADYLNYSGNATHVEMRWTVPTGASSYGDLGFSVQNFDKPASTNISTWYIKNVRLELLTSETYGYVTGTNIIEA